MNRYSANSTKMYYIKSGETTETELEYLMEVPEFGGTPEKIDVTVLSDNVKKYIPGIKDLGDLVFKFLYDNSTDTSNYRILSGLAKNNTPATFIIKYPDLTTHSFVAVPAVKMDAGSLNGALTFSVTMLLQSDITVKDLGQA
jgi:hypothetical protein